MLYNEPIMQWARRQKGFTIVELLIVIVVIAILAALTIVAYNGITQRANNSAAQSAAAQVAKKIATYLVDNNETLPADLSTLGLPGTAGATYQYTANNSTTPKGYCLTTTVNGTSYYIASNYTYTASSTTTINQPTSTSGACPGHSPTGTAVSNYSTNPSVEVSTVGFAGPNSSVIARDTSRAYQGVASLVTTMPVAAGAQVGAYMYNGGSLGGANNLQLSTTYTASMYVYVPTGTVDPYISIQSTGVASVVNGPTRTTSLKNQWVRLTNTFTTTATTGFVRIYVLNLTATGSAGTQFWIDGFMISDGTSAYTYADGNSSGWIWTGTGGLSPSVGPAL